MQVCSQAEETTFLLSLLVCSPRVIALSTYIVILAVFNKSEAKRSAVLIGTGHKVIREIKLQPFPVNSQRYSFEMLWWKTTLYFMNRVRVVAVGAEALDR